MTQKSARQEDDPDVEKLLYWDEGLLVHAWYGPMKLSLR